MLREFESYRNEAETALREQHARWRNAGRALLDELLANLGVDTESAEAAPAGATGEAHQAAARDR